MKKRIFLMLFLIVSFILQLQGFNLKVKLLPTKATRSATLEKDAKINNILSQYETQEFVQCYPNAKNPELLLYYSLKGTGSKENMIRELQNTAMFEFIEEDEIVYALTCTNPSVINDPLASWELDMIEAGCAWSITKGSPNIRIGIADTDFDVNHEDLKNQFVSVDGNISGGHHHGTAVAGMAAAQTNNRLGTAGIGYNSKIAAHRVIHYLSGGSASAFSSDIRTAIWNLYLAGVPVINVSWGGTGLDYAAAQEITQYGTTLVLAAGNSVSSISHNNLANIPGVIVVSGVNSENKNGPTNSARNQWVDLCAPGYGVLPTRAGSTYSVGSGTSFAAPVVAGTVALMLEVNSCLTPSGVEDMLKRTTDPIADGASYPGLLGTGRLNAYKAVKLAGTRELNNLTLTGTRTISAGYGFFLKNVTVGSNSHINLTARKEVSIDNNFTVPLGSSFTINIDSQARTSCD